MMWSRIRATCFSSPVRSAERSMMAWLPCSSSDSMSEDRRNSRGRRSHQPPRLPTILLLPPSWRQCLQESPLGEPPQGQPSPAPRPSSPIPLLEKQCGRGQTKEALAPTIPWALPFSALGSLCCPSLMREAPGTQISNDPQVGTSVKSWLGDKHSSPLFFPKMPLQIL